MYPNLRFAFYDIFGLDLPFLGLVQSYGFFLAISFLVAAWWLMVEFRRRESAGLMQGVEESYKVGEPISAFDIIWNLILGFFLGFKGVYAIMNADAFSGDNAKANLMSWEHGNWIAGIIGAAGFVLWKYLEKKSENKNYPEPKVLTRVVMPHQRIGDIVILSAISGVFGAKVFYLAEEQPSADRFWDAALSGSGLTIYGGLIIAFIVVSIYIYRKKINYLHLLDTAAPALILAYGVGRLGCHFSGDGDWGIANTSPKPFSFLPDWMWAYSYPNNVVNSSDQPHNILTDCGGYPFGDVYGYCTELAPPVYPTSVWEFLLCVIIFLILFSLRKWATQSGLLFSIYLIFNGIERFSIETIRVNPDYQFMGFNLSQAQFIALILLAIGVISSSFLYFRQRKNAQLTA
jgi:phosphatidylglycerol---prolipoprotein diacylglyceryl transferase